ncbi:MAG: NTPase [Candidatus Caldarchaeum sp.]
MTTFKTAALTGRPGIGKTTALMKIVDVLRKDGFTVGGFYTRELRRAGVRYGFEICDIGLGRTAVLASVDISSGPRVGKYRLSLENMLELGVASLRNAIKTSEAVFVDEVGPMELFCTSFIEAVRELLKTGKPSLLTIHHSARHPVVEEVRQAAGEHLYVLDFKNRDRVPDLVYGVMRKWLRS